MLNPRKSGELEEEEKKETRDEAIQVCLTSMGLYMNEKQVLRYLKKHLPEMETPGLKKQVGKSFGFMEFKNQEELNKFKAKTEEHPLCEGMHFRDVKHKMSGLRKPNREH